MTKRAVFNTGHLNAKKMPMKAPENILVFYNDLAHRCRHRVSRNHASVPGIR